MSDLVTWLRTQLDDDERLARDATVEHSGEADWSIRHGEVLWLPVMDSCDPASMPPGMAEHIARHDPEHVLADVEAKRRLLDEIVDDANSLDFSLDLDRRVGQRDLEVEPYVGDQLARILALPYAGREGYQPEWAPTAA